LILPSPLRVMKQGLQLANPHMALFAVRCPAPFFLYKTHPSSATPPHNFARSPMHLYAMRCLFFLRLWHGLFEGVAFAFLVELLNYFAVVSTCSLFHPRGNSHDPLLAPCVLRRRPVGGLSGLKLPARLVSVSVRTSRSRLVNFPSSVF